MTEAPLQPGLEPSEAYRWYVIMTKGRQESLAVAQLLEKGILTWQPMINVREAHGRGRSRDALRPLFPGILFTMLDLERDPWHLIFNCPGVDRMLPRGGRPLPLGHSEVAFIQRAAEFYALPPAVQRRRQPERVGLFKIGDLIRISEGPFSAFNGRIAEFRLLSGEERVRVLLDCFGGKTPVELPVSAVEHN